MRKLIRRLALALALLMLCALAANVLAEGDEEISLFEILGTGEDAPGATPDPDATPTPSPTPVLQADGSIQVTISAAGDVTIGKNAQHSGSSIFEKELKKQDGDIHFMFRNVRDILAQDDLTIVNFEGVLGEELTIPSNKRGNDYLFYGPPSYAQALSGASIEAVAFENNHAYDFGEDGYQKTVAALEAEGVVWSGNGRIGVYETQGVRIAMLSYQTFDRYDTLFEQVPREVADAKAQYDLVIVSFHWGSELDYKPNANQQKMAKMTIDAGADLVLGHHSHRINPIEIYNGKYIVYSLANFSFAGNNKPSDMSTFIFQTRFKIKDGAATPNGFRIVPCRISSRTDYNDFIPTPYTNQTNIDSLLSVLEENGRSLDNPVASYPLDWE